MDHHLEPLHQKCYLVDGQLLEWKGETRDVVSPIGPSTIGSYPLLTATESLAALQAAVKAYDQGRGGWPTMSVAERIERLDPETLARLIDPLVNQVCRVNLSCQCQRGPDMLPFTGRKDSAEGTLSISDALRVFSIRTLVAARQTPASKALLTRILRERHSNFLSTDFLF